MLDLTPVALELQAGQPLILQRVRRSVTAAEVAGVLQEHLDRPVRVVAEPTEAGEEGVRVWDARQSKESSFDGWDVQRATLASSDNALVVLLDVVTSTWLIVAAPHVVSWAGGVRLPCPPSVRPALSEEEIRLGERLLREALAERPGLRAQLGGLSLAVDLASGRIFTTRGGTPPLSLARDHMDEGVVWITRLQELGVAS